MWGAILMLGIDIGQPIRGWFGFWHANVHSMLTEVMFCITTYAIVLTIELLPSVLDNRRISRVPEFGTMSHNLHTIMIVFAAAGTFLSFFHQGSLGGMFGVLYARPFAARGGLGIWPWTFFLFIMSAIAVGPSFTTMVVMITEKISGRKLTKHSVKMLMGKISGWLLVVYMVCKSADTLWWTYIKLPSAGLTLDSMYQAPYGFWAVVGGAWPVRLAAGPDVGAGKGARQLRLDVFGHASGLHRHHLEPLCVHHPIPGPAGASL